MDTLGLATAEDKILAIKNIEYPNTAAKMERYLGLTGYLRRFIPYYAKLVAPLQNEKTALLADAPRKGNQRRSFASKAMILEDDVMKQAFYNLQACFENTSFLYHYSPDRPLYVDVDASIEFGFSAIVYHVKDDPEPILEPEKMLDNGVTIRKAQLFPYSSIQPIVFLSKCLSATEKRY